MTDRVSVPGQQYEDAREDLSLIYRDYAAARTLGRERTVGRFGSVRAESDNRATQLAIAAMVATVEHFVEAVLVAHGSPARSIQNWNAKEQAWSTQFSVELTASGPHYLPMIGCYEARTAIMHARGHLTDAQRRSPRKERVDDALGAAGISRIRRELILTPEVALRCRTICSAALLEIEQSWNPTAHSPGVSQWA